MQAARDPALAAILQQATDAFTKLHREILVQLMPHGAELDSAVVEDLSNVTLTFINGLLLRFAHGDRVVDSPEQLDGILSAIAAGILKSPHKGRLTDGDAPRATRHRLTADFAALGLARACAVWFSTRIENADAHGPSVRPLPAESVRFSERLI